VPNSQPEPALEGRAAHVPRATAWLAVVALAAAGSCASSPSDPGDADHLAEEQMKATVTVTSSAFEEGTSIPREFTCEGDDVSPPLSWTGVPDDAVELALVVDDPDARGGTYVHWVLFRLGATLSGVDEGTVQAGARQAKNSAGDARYKGPCPPEDDEAHHYRFSLYALDEQIVAPDGASTGDVLTAIRDAAIDKGTLTGTFDR
jgi:Raf kinase inhibitor-like YbhB/YbcL family protein